MKNTQLLMIVALLLSLPSYAQDIENPDVTNVAKITILNPGFAYEARVAKYQTIYAQAFINTSTYSITGGYGRQTTFYFDPALDVQYRFYYNARTRVEKEKRFEKNSMNYVAAAFELIYTRMPILGSSFFSTQRRPVNTYGVLWGFQRNYKSRFSLDFNIGPGLQIANTSTSSFRESYQSSGFTLMSQINLGIWLGSRGD
jgi:hypothetical protein